ncbi:MAG TPA: T9SS type A sorting domain-containing protein [Bacteroidia bacterium]|nr:T9SS type A sorting domain-containing protein [Bacteroidia bacterium]
MRHVFFLLPFLIFFITKGNGQAIINGDFENNTDTCLINIDNATYNLNMYNSTAFGTFQNLDIVKNTCGYGPSQNGDYCIFIAVSNIDTNFQEAISFDLSSPLQAGISYTLTFFDRDINGFSTAPIEIGVSSSNNTFGNFIGSIPAGIIASAWTMRTLNFVSPINANYITVTVGGNITNSGNAIDNFQLNVSSGIHDNSIVETSLLISPVPFSSQLNINLNNNKLSEIILYDIAAQKLLQQKFTNTITLNTSQLAKGMYLYEVRNPDSHRGGMVKKGKLIKD